MSRIAIFGAGAIGLDLGVNLINSGQQVTFLARGLTLDLLRKEGIHYRRQGKDLLIKPDRFEAYDDATACGVQNFVFLTVKADALLSICSQLPPLIDSSTSVISATNGIPPWYSYLQDTTIGRFPVNTGPRETFLKFVPPDQLFGATIARSVVRHKLNHVVHSFGTGYVIGELNHKVTDRVLALKDMLAEAELTVEISTDIHRDIWTKLLGNICVSPLSVIHEMKIGELMADPSIRKRAVEITEEAYNVGMRLGVVKVGDYQVEQFMQLANGPLKDHVTSMLQDFRSGRSLEIHRIVEVVIILADLPGVNANVSGLKKVYEELSDKVRRRDLV